MSAAVNAHRQAEQGKDSASGLILGIDPGLAKTGWAILWPAPVRPRMLCGSWESDKDAPNLDRVREMGGRFLRILREYQPASVAIESFGYQAGQRTSSQGTQTIHVFQRIVTLCDERLVPVVPMTPAQIKKLCKVEGKVTHETFYGAFEGVPFVTNEHGRDAGLAAWAGWLKGVTT